MIEPVGNAEFEERMIQDCLAHLKQNGVEVTRETLDSYLVENIPDCEQDCPFKMDCPV